MLYHRACIEAVRVKPDGLFLLAWKVKMSKVPNKLKTINALPKGESFVSMVVHNGRLYVAATNGVYILESAINIESKERSEWLRKLTLVPGK